MLSVLLSEVALRSWYWRGAGSGRRWWWSGDVTPTMILTSSIPVDGNASFWWFIILGDIISRLIRLNEHYDTFLCAAAMHLRPLFIPPKAFWRTTFSATNKNHHQSSSHHHHVASFLSEAWLLSRIEPIVVSEQNADDFWQNLKNSTDSFDCFLLQSVGPSFLRQQIIDWRQWCWHDARVFLLRLPSGNGDKICFLVFQLFSTLINKVIISGKISENKRILSTQTTKRHKKTRRKSCSDTCREELFLSSTAILTTILSYNNTLHTLLAKRRK